MSRPWIDVSRPLATGIPVWPGDVPFELTTSHPEGCSISRIAGTCHVGTHAETGLHVEPGHPPLAEVGLDTLCGPAEVVAVELHGARAVAAHHLSRGWRPAAPRVLFRTGTFPAGTPEIAPGFAGLDPELVHLLAEARVILVGIDTPSVDPMEAEHLPAHHALAQHRMVWIEGLDLSPADPGLYDMIALPLPLSTAEAAPTRVALRPLHPLRP